MSTDLILTVMNYTTQASFKSHLIDFHIKQKLMETNSCLGQEVKYIYLIKMLYSVQQEFKNGQLKCEKHCDMIKRAAEWTLR